MNIVILRQVEREFRKVPKEVLIDVYALFDELTYGKTIGMPHSRPLPSIAKGLHELRLTNNDGIYRIFYVIKMGDSIYILHILKKKTQKLSKQVKQLLLSRIKELNI